MANLSADRIVKVIVNVASAINSLQNIDTSLVIGTSAIVSKEDRVKVYDSLEAMKADGFTDENAEYVFAKSYFEMNKRGIKLAVGLWAKSGADGETALDAVRACRAASGSWFLFTVLGPTESDYKSVAEWANQNAGAFLFARDNSEAALTASTGDLGSTLKASNVTHAWVEYTDTDDDLARLMGFISNTHIDSSVGAFSMNYKPVAGMKVMSLNDTQLTNLLSKGYNVYVNVCGHDMIQNGRSPEGTSFDEVLGLQQLIIDVKRSIVSYLANKKSKVPHTDEGTREFIGVIGTALEKSASSGFITTGEWTGDDVGELKTGDIIENGYSIQAGSVSEQTAEARKNHISPPIQLCLKLAGSMESVVVNIMVNQ